MKARGQHASHPVVTRADLATSGHGDQYLVVGAVDDDAITLVDARGSTVANQHARSQNVQIVVSWVGGRWVISAQNAFTPTKP